MKKTLFAALLVISFTAFAQKPITVDVVPQPTGKDAQRSFIVEIPQTTLTDVEKDWVRYVGEGSKGRAVVVDEVHHQSGAFNFNISPYAFDVHSKLTETSEGVRLTVWFSQNNATFTPKDSSSGYDQAVQKYVRDFAVQEYRQAVQNELKGEQDKLNEMEKELDVLVKDEEKSTKTINENQRSTDRANDAIATNNSDMQSSSDKIYDQKKMVEVTASDPKATKGAKKTLGDLEDEREGLQKENETQGKNNDSRDKENREEERNIAGTRQNQDLKTTDIERQRQKVYEVQTKLDNIK